ncbi:MAG: PepSY domain-containing protein [Thiohalobacteraceae bacterium]|nr:PepSY domain-containing protein [Gammaproteobacteria bacterium]
MNKSILAISLASVLVAGGALADERCDDPISDWQSRDALRQKLEDNGWKVKRIKIDDGCYEVKGVDHNGNRFEATYAPASLEILELEIKFDNTGSETDYLGEGMPTDSASVPSTRSARPTATIE